MQVPLSHQHSNFEVFSLKVGVVFPARSQEQAKRLEICIGNIPNIIVSFEAYFKNVFELKVLSFQGFFKLAHTFISRYHNHF